MKRQEAIELIRSHADEQYWGLIDSLIRLDKLDPVAFVGEAVKAKVLGFERKILDAVSTEVSSMSVSVPARERIKVAARPVAFVLPILLATYVSRAFPVSDDSKREQLIAKERITADQIGYRLDQRKGPSIPDVVLGMVDVKDGIETDSREDRHRIHTAIAILKRQFSVTVKESIYPHIFFRYSVECFGRGNLITLADADDQIEQELDQHGLSDLRRSKHVATTTQEAVDAILDCLDNLGEPLRFD